MNTEQAFKLTPEQARAEWVKALRSGEYKQGKLCLTSVNGQDADCCLGVACKVFLKIEGNRIGVTRCKGYLEYGDHSTTLPRIVGRWLGGVTSTGKVCNGQRSLAGCNDGGETFEQIADRIERGEVLLAEATP